MKKAPKTNLEKIAETTSQIKTAERLIAKSDFFNAIIKLDLATNNILELLSVITDQILIVELKELYNNARDLKRQAKLLKIEFGKEI